MTDDTPIAISVNRPIPIAIDFSPDSDAAIDWGLNQAVLTGAPVILFHAIHDSAEAPGVYSRDGEAGLTSIADAAQAMMDAQLARLEPGLKALAAPVEIGAEMIEGLPAGRIVEAARAHDAQLIVIGTRGRSRMAALLLGSVAESVIKTSPSPVVVVKAERAGEADADD